MANVAENTFLRTSFATSAAPQLWIGLTDAGAEGSFAWIGGEPTEYFNWAPGQPFDVSGNEDYVLMVRGTGRWSDVADVAFIGAAFLSSIMRNRKLAAEGVDTYKTAEELAAR